MILINRTETDPYFNIAAEEYVLKAFDEDVFMLWVNSPSVIIGKHQVAAAEADVLHTFRHNIPVIRRISGGGTVYHDEGNLNYSLVSNGDRSKLVDYLKYAGTVIRALKKAGIEARLENKSSLFTKGKKFSGNAEHVFRNRVLHHGTLLFDTDSELLRKCIRPAHSGYSDKSVRSVDSKTTNLNKHFPPGYSIESFKELILDQVYEDFQNIRPYSFSVQDQQSIHELVRTKYSGIDWNFGYSPKYSLTSKIGSTDNEINIELNTDKGRIRKLKITQGGEEKLENLSDALINIMHHPKTVSEVLNKINFAGYNIPPDQLLEGMF